MTAIDRRNALRLGSLAVGAGAVVAACGGDDEEAVPGRVGFLPPVTDPPNLNVDDAVLLRTAASLETTIIDLYEAFLDLDVFDQGQAELLQTLIEGHQDARDIFDEQTTVAGGEVWPCANPWYVQRTIEPMLEVVADSDNPLRDAFNIVATMENTAGATYQEMSGQLTIVDERQAMIEVGKQMARQSAVWIIGNEGPDGYYSPELFGEESGIDESGVPLQYAITGAFGSVAQIEIVIGAPDENGVRTTFVVQTPSLNSYIYNETEPSC